MTRVNCWKKQTILYKGKPSGPEHIFSQHSLQPPSTPVAAEAACQKKAAFIHRYHGVYTQPTQLSHLCSIFVPSTFSNASKTFQGKQGLEAAVTDRQTWQPSGMGASRSWQC